MAHASASSPRDAVHHGVDRHRRGPISGCAVALYQGPRLPNALTNQGSGYFSIVEGKNGRLYIGTAKYGVNAYLVEFDPAPGK